MADERVDTGRLGDTVSVVILTIALPYLTGFFYLASYYQFFSISMTELGISEPEVYTASFVAAWKIVLLTFDGTQSKLVVSLFLILCVALLLIGFFSGHGRRSKYMLRPVARLTDLVRRNRVSPLLWTALVSLIAFPFLGSIVGNRSARNDLGNLPIIVLVDLSSGINHIGRLDAVLEQQLLEFPMDRLIFANESSYFILRSEAGNSPSTFRIQRDSKYLTIVPIVVE